MDEERLARLRDDGAAVLELAVVAQDDVEERLLAHLVDARDPIELAVQPLVAEDDLAAQAAGVGELHRVALHERVGLELAEIVHERGRDGEIAIDAREHLGRTGDGLGDGEAVLEQPVAVGLVHALGGRRDAVLRPGVGALAEHRLEERAHARILDRRDERTQAPLELGHRHRRAGPKLGGIVGALGRRIEALEPELRPEPLVHLVAAVDAVGRPANEERGDLVDVVPDVGGEGSGAVGEGDFEEVLAVRALAPFDIPNQQDELAAGAVGEVADGHADEPRDGCGRRAPAPLGAGLSAAPGRGRGARGGAVERDRALAGRACCGAVVDRAEHRADPRHHPPAVALGGATAGVANQPLAEGALSLALAAELVLDRLLRERDGEPLTTAIEGGLRLLDGAVDLGDHEQLAARSGCVGSCP